LWFGVSDEMIDEMIIECFSFSLNDSLGLNFLF